LQSLSIGTGNYNVNIAQSPNSIGGETIFNNTGTVTLGSSGAVNFVGGVIATAPSQVILLGNVRAQGTGVINLGTAVQVSGTSVTVGGASTGDITLGSTTLDNGVTLTVGTGIANAIKIGSVNGTAGGSASNLAINTTLDATVGEIRTDIGSFTASAGILISTGAVNAGSVAITKTGSLNLGGSVTSSGAITLTTDSLTMPSPYQIKSTGGGTISFAPTIAGRSIWIGSGDPGTTKVLNLGSVLGRTLTSGLVAIGVNGSGGSGAITVAGKVDASANGFSSFSVRSQNSGLNFSSQNGQLLLPEATAVDFQLGLGNIAGSTSIVNLSAPNGSVRFVSAGGVTLGTSVSQLLSSTLIGGLVLLNSESLKVVGTQRVGIDSGLLVQTTSESVTLNSDATFYGKNLTIAPAQNFYNYAGSDPFQNSSGGRTLVYSYQSLDNYPSDVTAGLTGFSSVFRVPQSFVYQDLPRSYTVSNANLIPSGDSMVYSGNPVIPDLPTGTGLVNGFVNDTSYLTTVPTLGYSIPSTYTGPIRLGFKSTYAKNSTANATIASQGESGGNQKKEPEAPASAQTKEEARNMEQVPAVSPGRLKVGEVKKDHGGEKAIQARARQGTNFRVVEVGVMPLRMSGEFQPFELSEVTIQSEKVSKDR
jgi:hypothetical protein